MVGGHSWLRGRAESRRRIVAGVGVPALTAGLLGLLAVTESIGRSALSGVSTQRAAVLCMVALATTLPPALMAIEAAAIAVLSATVVSLALFHTLTVAALVAQLAATYRLAREGSPPARAQSAAAGLAAMFLVLVLTKPTPSDSEAGVLTVLLASLAPAAAFAGIAARARGEALRNDA
ncbi:MAG: hypothetical protein WCB67_10185, partial [Solirubrobacteraceae bacterium]